MELEEKEAKSGSDSIQQASVEQQQQQQQSGSEEVGVKKYGQMSIVDFNNVKVHSPETSSGKSNGGIAEPISRRRSSRVVVKRKDDSDEEPEHSRKKRAYNRKVVVKEDKSKKKSKAKKKAGESKAGVKDKDKSKENDKNKEKEKDNASSKKRTTTSKPKASAGAKTGAKENTKENAKEDSKVKATGGASAPASKSSTPKKSSDTAKKNSPKPSGSTEKKKDGKVSPEEALKKSKTASKPAPSLSLAVNPILLENWAPQVPLSSSDFKTQNSVLSRLKFPHMKKVHYAKDLIYVLSFINKFHKFLPKDLWPLSIQDLEIGLDVYAENMDEEQIQQQYYADYISAKEIRRCQDHANLLYVILMELTLNRKSYSTLQTLQTSIKPYKSIIELRQKSVEFGYPKEWKVASTLTAERTKVFEKDDVEPVDPSHPEILTPNVYKWQEQLIVPIEEDPMHNPDLERLGLLALQPADRVVLLRTLTQWCISYSEKIHAEVYRLSHLRKDPSFGIQTYQAPRHLVYGIDATKQHFKKLCTLVKERMELRRSKKHVKKHLENGTRQDLLAKFDLLDQLKKKMVEYKQEHMQTTTDKKQKFDPLDVSIERDYEQWSKLVFEETHDNGPMDNPYEDEIYKLRCLEFFIGRVPYIGDFYLPRLLTYQSPKSKYDIPTNYCDPITLLKTLRDFENGVITPFELFGKGGKLNSMQFKLYYHDTPAMIHDLLNNKSNDSSCYWYEMCHDSESLQDFIKLLEFKIYKEEDPNKSKKTATAANTAAANPNPVSSEQPSNNTASEPSAEKQDSNNVTESPQPESKKETPISNTTKPPAKLEPIEGFNCNPLPKEYKYNKSRSKLLILKEYLQKMASLLRTFEQLKAEYGDMSITDRNLRRSQRTKINYNERRQIYDDEEEEEEEEDNEAEHMEIEPTPENVDDYDDPEELVASEHEDFTKNDDDHSDNYEDDEEEVEEEYEIESEVEEEPVKKRRGRPPKKKRGRPPKNPSKVVKTKKRRTK